MVIALFLGTAMPILAAAWFVQFRSLQVVRLENRSSETLRQVRIAFAHGSKEVAQLDPGGVVALRFSSMGMSGTVRISFEQGQVERQLDCGYYWVILSSDLVDVWVGDSGKFSCTESPLSLPQ
jgi:hypothetical protein